MAAFSVKFDGEGHRKLRKLREGGIVIYGGALVIIIPSVWWLLDTHVF